MIIRYRSCHVHLDAAPGGPDGMMVLTGRVERLIARMPREVNCALFLIGFYLGVSFLLAHLSWYGLPQAPPGWTVESYRMLMKMSIFLMVVTAIALVAPGTVHRRLFSACIFPLLALTAMLLHDISFPLVTSLRPSQDVFLDTLFQAAVLGWLVALIVSVPVAILFRGSCLPVVLLVVLPALAKEQSVAWRSLQTNVTAWPLATLLFEAAIVAVSTYGSYRYLYPSSRSESIQ